MTTLGFVSVARLKLVRNDVFVMYLNEEGKA